MIHQFYYVQISILNFEKFTENMVTYSDLIPINKIIFGKVRKFFRKNLARKLKVEVERTNKTF